MEGVIWYCAVGIFLWAAFAVALDEHMGYGHEFAAVWLGVALGIFWPLSLIGWGIYRFIHWRNRR